MTGNSEKASYLLNEKTLMDRQQVLKYARELSDLYRSEKENKLELEIAHVKMKEYSVSLEEDTKEYTDFAFIASHDLQEPLRKICLLSDRVKDCSKDLDNLGRDYLDRLQKAVIRMQKCLNDLLKFSQVTQKIPDIEPTNLGQIADETLRDMDIMLLNKMSHIEIEKLPTIETDKKHMQLLFKNLISNSLKFHKENLMPIVKISSHPVNDKNLALVFEDNGIGFEEKYLDRIFKPFKRLHRSDEFEGTGMGLAICQEIVTGLGGTITAKSNPSEGATFIITLPIAQNPK